MSNEIRMRIGLDGRNRSLLAGNVRVQSNNRIFGSQLFIGDINFAVALQHRLKSVCRLGPGEILDIPERLSKVPRDYHAIGEFLGVTSAGHPRLEERADRGSTVEQTTSSLR